MEYFSCISQLEIFQPPRVLETQVIEHLSKLIGCLCVRDIIFRETRDQAKRVWFKARIKIYYARSEKGPDREIRIKINQEYRFINFLFLLTVRSC